MASFFAENWGTILVAAVVVAIIAVIVVKMLKDKRKGKTSCGCGCANCPSAGICHSGKKKK